MTYPLDIQRCMRDCILALMWRKKDIVEFFRKHGCTEQDLRDVRLDREPALTRVQIVDTAFAAINRRSDEGLGIFRAMMQSLLTWSHFDPYFFDTLQKLDRAQAEAQLQHLRQLQEIRDRKLHAERERRAAAHAAVPAGPQLDKVRKEFLTLHAGATAPQSRGYALERILRDLAQLSGLEVTEPFRTHGEQIDGAVKFEGEHYVIEAKWQDTAASNEPVYQFAGKVEGKMYGRGIFVSIQGFSTNVVTSLVQGKAIRTIFVDGADMTMVLEGQLTFSQMLDQKVKAAQTRGEIYVNPLNGRVKVG